MFLLSACSNCSRKTAGQSLYPLHWALFSHCGPSPAAHQERAPKIWRQKCRMSYRKPLEARDTLSLNLFQASRVCCWFLKGLGTSRMTGIVQLTVTPLLSIFQRTSHLAPSQLEFMTRATFCTSKHTIGKTVARGCFCFPPPPTFAFTGSCLQRQNACFSGKRACQALVFQTDFRLGFQTIRVSHSALYHQNSQYKQTNEQAIQMASVQFSLLLRAYYEVLFVWQAARAIWVPEECAFPIDHRAAARR